MPYTLYPPACPISFTLEPLEPRRCKHASIACHVLGDRESRGKSLHGLPACEKSISIVRVDHMVGREIIVLADGGAGNTELSWRTLMPRVVIAAIHYPTCQQWR